MDLMMVQVPWNHQQLVLGPESTVARAQNGIYLNNGHRGLLRRPFALSMLPTPSQITDPGRAPGTGSGGHGSL